MKDFVLAALPFIIMGISIAIIVVNCNKENKKSEKGTYINEGMCIGMSIGLLLGNLFDDGHLGIFLGLGMLIGEAIGSGIKKVR
ncbi:MAG: hypothetical protein ACI4OT_02475 [Bacilli bacterium]